jgi:hypothetical protein
LTGALQVEQYRGGSPQLGFHAPDDVKSLGMLGVGSTTEVEAKDIGAGREHGSNGVDVGAGWAQVATILAWLGLAWRCGAVRFMRGSVKKVPNRRLRHTRAASRGCRCSSTIGTPEGGSFGRAATQSASFSRTILPARSRTSGENLFNFCGAVHAPGRFT